MPVGRWVMRTAESVVLTPWPPGPLARYTSICRSRSSMSTSTSSASARISTVADDVWTPTLALGDRHALHAVRAALELQTAPGGVARDHERDLVEPAEVADVARQHLELPALLGGVAGVHVEQVAGEQVRFLAPFRAANLDDHRLAVVRVARGSSITPNLLRQAIDVGLRGLAVRRATPRVRRQWPARAVPRRRRHPAPQRGGHGSASTIGVRSL